MKALKQVIQERKARRYKEKIEKGYEKAKQKLIRKCYR